MKVRLAILFVSLAAAAASAAIVPGFSIERLGTVVGFPSCIAFDSRGTTYYTSTDGNIYRFEPVAGLADWQSTFIAHVPTDAIGDSGLLGMAFLDDNTAVVHYTTPNQTADVIAKVNITTGAVTTFYSFACDVDVPTRGSSPEHHGGNPVVAPDGSIFVGIGDIGNGTLAPDLHWNAGKVWRIYPDGTVHMFARGFRNPFDFAWDDAGQRLVLADNGSAVNDELDIVHDGDWQGWPDTMGTAPPVAGAVPPLYTWPIIVAPTGFAKLSGKNPILRQGYIMDTFTTGAVLWIPDVDVRPFPDPLVIFDQHDVDLGVLIDIAEGPQGQIEFVSSTTVYRLNVPKRGDCNGDGLVNSGDYTLLKQMTAAGSRPMIAANTGAIRGTWGCDVNGDNVIDGRDVSALAQQVGIRVRAARR